MKEITVLIADDHAIVRMGLSALLNADEDIKVIGESDDGVDAVKKVEKLKPDIAIIDIMMPEMDGVSATREIKKRFPNTKVLILTTSTVSDDFSQSLEAGADGIVTKDTANIKLLAAIRTIASGKRFVPATIAKKIALDPPVKQLTERQSKILEMVTHGHTNADIAKAFSIQQDSVREHLDAIFTKIGAANRAEAVGIALRKHLLKI